jgi:hypothetical protein
LDNSKSFTFIEVGALYGLVPSANRALYSATKAIGLDLCAALQRGGEVKRAIYVAPGPIDTHMLHRNHWVSKEHGSVEFFELVRLQPQHVYEDIFIHCRDEAFSSIASESREDMVDLRATFERYKLRRNQQFSDAHGVLAADQLADRLVNVVLDPTCEGGAYVITAPHGKMRSNKLSFSEIRYETWPTGA